MKLIYALLMTTFLSASLLAADTPQQAKLASDMRSMLNAVVDIQRAGFYANKTGIEHATKRLIANLNSLLETDAKEYLPHDQINAGKFAKKRVKMIKMYSADLIESINHNDYDEAMEDYAQLLRQCTSCHLRIRNRPWK